MPALVVGDEFEGFLAVKEPLLVDVFEMGLRDGFWRPRFGYFNGVSEGKQYSATDSSQVREGWT